MSNCTSLRFGSTNFVPQSILTSNVDPSLPLDNLKHEWRARPVWWQFPTGVIEITGLAPRGSVAEYIAIPADNLIGAAEIQFELIGDDPDSIFQKVLYQSESTTLATIKPLGEWRAGIDPYGVASDSTIPGATVLWLPEAIAFNSFVVRITPNLDDPSNFNESGVRQVNDLLLRMLAIGQMLELENPIELGSEIEVVSEPDLQRTSGGSYVPTRRQTASRQLTLSLPMMSDVDRVRLATMEVDLLGAPFMVSAHPGQSGWKYDQYNFLARFSRPISYKYQFEDLHEVSNLTLVEV